MKKLIMGLIAISAVSFSLTASADKVIVSGDPVVFKSEGDVWIPATTSITTVTEPFYVSMGETKRVCYTKALPGVGIDAGPLFSFRIGSNVEQLHCYDETYYTVK